MSLIHTFSPPSPMEPTSAPAVNVNRSTINHVGRDMVNQHNQLNQYIVQVHLPPAVVISTLSSGSIRLGNRSDFHLSHRVAIGEHAEMLIGTISGKKVCICWYKDVAHYNWDVDIRWLSRCFVVVPLVT
jgi:hypothetical protein